MSAQRTFSSITDFLNRTEKLLKISDPRNSKAFEVISNCRGKTNVGEITSAIQQVVGPGTISEMAGIAAYELTTGKPIPTPDPKILRKGTLGVAR